MVPLARAAAAPTWLADRNDDGYFRRMVRRFKRLKKVPLIESRIISQAKSCHDSSMQTTTIVTHDF
jgi:hypothetical protein